MTSIQQQRNRTMEAGTGYFKKTIDGNKVNPQMGNISVTVAHINQAANNQSHSSAGELSTGNILKTLIRSLLAATPLKLVKKLFIEKNTDRGPVLTSGE